MSQLPASLSSLFRPRLLMRAARFGLRHYDRARHLPRVLGHGFSSGTASVAARLMDIEAELDAKRMARDAAYSAQRHVDILTALLAEIDYVRGQSRAPAA